MRTRRANLMIAVLPDEVSAFEAYRLLQLHGISPENLALVGKGYTAPESVGLVEPSQVVWRYGCYGMAGLSGLGVLLGLGLGMYWQTSWQILAFLGAIGLGAGASLGLVLGMVYGIVFKSATAIACHNYLKRGQYLLLLEGSEALTRRGREILSHYAQQPYSP
ncbi:MAG: hypothetical protein ACK4QL_03130 [Pseudanabaenaceae cyanobacterium]